MFPNIERDIERDIEVGNLNNRQWERNATMLSDGYTQA
jgi:hypothetical protein